MGRNMKHIKVFTKLAMVVAGTFMLASFSPSLDGRAVVVDEGVMPSGLFAKTVGYLPGDVISVSNAGGSGSVDLLVIGALDASEGVAIMLTPEAAKAVGIEKDSNSIVKITKRNGQDDRVYGNAVISSDKNANAAEKTQKAAVKDNPSADSVAEEVFQEESTAELAAENPVENLAEAAAGVSGSPMFDESEELSQASEENTAESPAPVTASPVEKPAEEVAKDIPAKETQFDKLVDEAAPKTEESSAVAVLPSDSVEEEDEEELKEIAEIPEIEENNSNEAVIPGHTAFAQPDQTVTEESDEGDYDSYDAIVLVPALANPPVSDDPDYKPLEKTAAVGRPLTPAPAKTALSGSSVSSYDSLLVNSEKDLIRNAYYVQIATMRDDANILEVVNKYGNNYPITIVQLSNNSKQILIGSLSIDEYAVVLERFKSYGYKDAFLRKIR